MSGAPARGARLLAWGRVLRLSLAPSAAADAAAGCVLGAAAWPGGAAPFALILGSLCVYHGGMALNDWADRAEDARARPERPLPAGTLRPNAVLALAVALLLGGVLLARQAGPAPARILAAVAALAAFYDLGPRGPWLGPLLLGLCRVGNLGAGVALGLDARGGTLGAGTAAVLALYGVYVTAVSRLGRLEDRPPGTPLGSAPARSLLLAAGVLVAVPLVAGDAGPALRVLAVAVAVAASFPLARAALATSAWTPERVLPRMGMALRRLLVFTSLCALVAGGAAGAVVGVLVLGGYPLSWALRRAFPPS